VDDLQRAADNAGVGDDFVKLMDEQRLANADVNKTPDVSLSEGGDFKELGKLTGGELKARPYLAKMLASPENFEVIQRNATPEQMAQLRGDIVEYLGLVRAGGQDATGTVISPNEFLTKWNKIDPRVKNMLFDDDLGTRQTLDDIATVAADFKRRGLEANTSRTAGTGQAAMAISGMGDQARGMIQGGLGTGTAVAGYANPAATAASVVMTYATLKGLMSETLARWAAGQTPSLSDALVPRVPGAVGRGVTPEEEKPQIRIVRPEK
jgi:hypothetical protein